MKKIELLQLYTEEGEKLKNGAPLAYHTVYPRPQMERNSFFSLNGQWDFAANGEKWEQITVPFPPESLLSGIGRSVGFISFLQYRKRFTLPDGFVKSRVLLHFGAVDQCAAVKINGETVGTNAGGYLPFELDITDALKDGENEIEVTVTDDMTDKSFPYGKQRYNRGGMWYTPVSGIWQSVWLESVTEQYIKSIKITPTTTGAIIKTEGVTDGELTVTTPEGEEKFTVENGEVTVNPRNIRYWSPEAPYLYRFTLKAGEDEIRSYFAIRTVETKTVNGIPRICLNGSPIFLHALLDQGYYSDGIYTPASPECYEQDILTAKKLGFNTLRKHIKIEPELFYYYCDLHGVIVMQDMVNNGSYSFLRDTLLPTVFMKSFPDKLLNRDDKVRDFFFKQMKDTVKALYNHPCICYWTIFNEGWGQFDSTVAYRFMKTLDSTRTVDTASGWYHPKESEVESVHCYFKPFRLKKDKKLPTVLSEFGGYSLQIAEHTVNLAKSYGYKAFATREDFENAIIKLYETEIIPAVKDGLCGAVLTQITDVEDEINGLITYDRKAIKVSEERMNEIAKKLYSAR